jgi:hypothetical protein
MSSVETPSYLRTVVVLLRTEESGLWRWFGSADKLREQAEAVRLDLLKSTYRLDRESQPALHQLADDLRTTMGISAEATFYQGAATEVINGALAYLPGEANIILSGPVLTALDPLELRALLAHELAHFLLFEAGGGEFRIAADLIHALSLDASAGVEFAETARLVRLYTEVYADRWSFRACGDIAPPIRTLVKAQTGLADVSAESYLRQAAEIFAKGPVRTTQLTHPEVFIRARALELWAERGAAAETEIAALIEGPPSIAPLDLLAQRRVRDWTRQFVAALLVPGWFRSDAVVAHAQRFFADFEPSANEVDVADLKETLAAADPSLRDYLCYVLLDFVTIDRDLGEAALAAALSLARKIDIDDRFRSLAQKELGITKKALAKIDDDSERILEEAAIA